MNVTQKKMIGIGLIVLGIVLAGMVLMRSLYWAPDTDLTPVLGVATSSVAAGGVVEGGREAPAPPEPASRSSLPSHLSIPKIGVNAAVQYVGVKANNQMANPSNFSDVGWYKDGTVPGRPGSAVMAGHVDNALALDGVFKELSDLSPGDLVYVTRRDGEQLTFRVDRLAYYHYLDAPNREIFLSSDGRARLNLVTCAGTWLRDARSYDQRLVVYTTLVE